MDVAQLRVDADEARALTTGAGQLESVAQPQVAVGRRGGSSRHPAARPGASARRSTRRCRSAPGNRRRAGQATRRSGVGSSTICRGRSPSLLSTWPSLGGRPFGQVGSGGSYGVAPWRRPTAEASVDPDDDEPGGGLMSAGGGRSGRRQEFPDVCLLWRGRTRTSLAACSSWVHDIIKGEARRDVSILNIGSHEGWHGDLRFQLPEERRRPGGKGVLPTTPGDGRWGPAARRARARHPPLRKTSAAPREPVAPAARRCAGSPGRRRRDELMADRPPAIFGLRSCSTTMRASSWSRRWPKSWRRRRRSVICSGSAARWPAGGRAGLLTRRTSPAALVSMLVPPAMAPPAGCSAPWRGTSRRCGS